MNKPAAVVVALGIGCSSLVATNLRADDFIRITAGDFSSANWYNATTGQGPNAGPPGGGDNAYLGGLQVTSSGASVLSVGAGTLTLTGPFSAPTISGGLTLLGSGKLTSQTGAAVVNGGHLIIQNYNSPVIIITNGGSIDAATIPAKASGSVTGGGSLTVASTVNDFNLTLGGGATARAPTVINGLSVTVTINDAGSTLNLDDGFSVKGGFVDINKGTLKVGSQMALDGGTDNGGRPAGGGGHWQGSGATISAPAIFIGDKVGSFSLGIDTGAVVTSGQAIIAAEAGSSGTVTMSDPQTSWQVQSGLMAIGQSGRGTFTLSPGARLALDSGTALAVGFGTGSTGRLSAENAVVDVRGAQVAIGQRTGSNGSISLTSSSQLAFAPEFRVGDSGNGSLTLSSSSTATGSDAAGPFLIGNSTGGSGSVSVSGAGSILSVAGPMTLGVSGAGSLALGNDAMVSLTNPAGLEVGLNAKSTGTVFFGPGGKMTLAGPLVLGDAGTASLELNSTAQLNLANLAGGNEVNLIVGNKTGAAGTLTVTNAGTFVDRQPLLIGKSGDGTFNALLRSSVQVSTLSAPFMAGGKATIRVDASDWINTGNIYLGSIPATAPPSTLGVRNNSTMRVGSQMTVFRSGTATIDSTSRMAVGSGDFGPAGSLRVSADGTLSGYGRVQGQVIVGQGGSIFPGNSTGIFTVEGSYLQESGSTTSVEIGGTEPGTGHDQIDVSGAAALNGSLRVRLVNGFTPAVGQTFRIVKAASISGAYASLSPPSQAGVAMSSDASGVILTVTSVVAGAPVIDSKTTVTVAPGTPFGYRITATNSPASFSATALPQGLALNASSGLISGVAATAGTYIVSIGADNAAGSGQADLVIQVDPVFKVSPLDGGAIVVEYRDSADFPGSPGGHFFYSSDVAEQAIVDSGAAGQFVRTGREFVTGGTSPVCRFYGSISPGPNSHFFTVDVNECNGLKAAQVTPMPGNVQQWNYEGITYTTTPATVGANGTRSCPADTRPIYRAYNNAFPLSGGKNPWDSNHRFTSELADIAAMVALGWRDEGIVFCTALPGS
ncbi:MAG: hypothetical protein ABI831_00710 [Betaproteobacteria bacterium]